MTQGLISGAVADRVYTEERCFIQELMNDARCADVSVAECRVQPGVTTQLHDLPIVERYVVTQGTGHMEMGEQAFGVSAGDSVVIPAYCAQRITNTGQDDLVFLCVCTPRFEPQHYRNLETSQ